MDRDRAAIYDMLHSCELISNWIADLVFQEFERNPILIRAVIYEIAVIGEATTRVSSELREKNQQVEWKDIKRMRNFLIHRYDQVDVELVWLTATTSIPALLPKLEIILKSI